MSCYNTSSTRLICKILPVKPRKTLYIRHAMTRVHGHERNLFVLKVAFTFFFSRGFTTDSIPLWVQTICLTSALPEYHWNLIHLIFRLSLSIRSNISLSVELSVGTSLKGMTCSSVYRTFLSFVQSNGQIRLRD